ncbi:MAG: hypothetical protein ACM30H_03655 [Clostridia bacterium]
MVSAPRVYVRVQSGKTGKIRLLDLAYVGEEPAAVRTWALVNGERSPSRYHILDVKLLRPGARPGTWWYEGIVSGSPARCRLPAARAARA